MEESRLDIEPFLDRHRTHEQIQRGGAIANLNQGIEIPIHCIATRLLVWPGNGVQT
jgi:gentisate 1,2-dioxygenase